MSVFVECIGNPTSIALQWGRTACLCVYVCVERVSGKMDTHLGTLGVSLDGRFSSVRTMETNLGEWICIRSPGWGTIFFSCSRWVHVLNQIAVQFVFVFNRICTVFECLWKLRENEIRFFKALKVCKNWVGFVKVCDLQSAGENLSAYQSETAFPKTKQ